MEAGKRLHDDTYFRRRFPLTVANAAVARPLSWALARMGLSPNQVTLLSLFVSFGGLVLVAEGSWLLGALGAVLVYVGLILDHADGQVARRTGKGSLFGMYLDSTLDRVIEAGMFVALIVAGVRRHAAWDDEVPWALLALDDNQTILVAAAAFVAVTMSKYVVTYSNVLFLRTHLLSGAPLPPTEAPYSIIEPKRPWRKKLPGYNRDTFLAFWCFGVAVGQVGPMLLLLTLLHVRLTFLVSRTFLADHKDPKRHVQRVVNRDYH